MLTVDHFLNAGLLPWFKILSGESVLKERSIEYVSVIELPVGDFVRKNELVLSTALGCEKAETLMLELITDIHRAQACALLLANPTDTIELPSSCEEYIRSQQFPVIIIPWECRFADLIEAVLKQIRDDVACETTLYENIHKKLLTAYLQNMPIDSSAQIIADALKNECMIYDVNYKCRGTSKSYKKQDSEEIINVKNLIKIQTNERLYGYFQFSPDNSIDINYALFDRYLISPLILWFDKEWVIQLTRQNAKDDFVWKLAKGSSESQDELIKAGEILGFNLLYTYTCIVGKIHSKNSNSEKERNKWIISNINSLKEEILFIASEVHKQIMLTYQQEQIIIYLENQSDHSDQHIGRFLDKVEKKFQSVFPHIVLSWGISEISNEPTNFHECYMHAKLAQELCAQNIMQNVRYTYENTILFSMLSVLSADHTIMKNAFRTIKPIIDHDNINQTDLLETLKVYLKLKNVSETARHLHLHRQSLLYRINKIEKLTNLSLKDSNSVFLLEICVRLHLNFSV
jgi:purine catabolism regulator